MLTKQQVFDKVVDRLMDNTGRSTESEHGGCLYLTENGLKCAVGIFLPDNEEIQSFKGDVYDLVDEFKDHLDFPKEIIEYKNLMYDLQRVHDRKYNWRGKKFIIFDRLESIAKRHKLEYKRPEDVN